VQNAATPSTGASNVSVDSINNRFDKICELLETMFKNNNADGTTMLATAGSTIASVHRPHGRI